VKAEPTSIDKQLTSPQDETAHPNAGRLTMRAVVLALFLTVLNDY
jgi:hypothetical protein